MIHVILIVYILIIEDQSTTYTCTIYYQLHSYCKHDWLSTNLYLVYILNIIYTVTRLRISANYTIIVCACNTCMEVSPIYTDMTVSLKNSNNPCTLLDAVNYFMPQAFRFFRVGGRVTHVWGRSRWKYVRLWYVYNRIQ